MLLGSRDMDVKFKKATVYDPNSFGGENQRIPYIRDIFNKIRYKVFPLTDPAFDKKKLYPQEYTEERALIDENIDTQEDAEMNRQIQNQLSPLFQNIELQKDKRM